MGPTTQATNDVENRLVSLLPRKERVRFLARCDTIDLVFGEAIATPDVPTQHVYFPLHGFVSLISGPDDTPVLEVGMVGCEGMLGVQIALGVARVPLRALTQGSGDALRMSAAGFRAELVDSPALRRIVGRYIYVLMAQLASSAACIRFHQIEARLARWLLMTRDRAHADRFPITHEFLAYMLGVRRVGITGAAGALKRQGLIQYHRGDVVVLEPVGLKRVACACYADDLRAYEAIMSRH